MSKVILINGKKRSGKDYVAGLLKKKIEENGLSCEIISFAEPLKDILSMTLNVPLEELDDHKNNKTPIWISEEVSYVKNGVKETYYSDKQITDFRAILQNFGTEAMKKWFGENIWVDIALNRIKNSDAGFILIPDFRFLCEHIDNAITLKILNDAVDNDSSDTHRSENELNDFVFDLYLDNSGYKDISDQINSLYKSLF